MSLPEADVERVRAYCAQASPAEHADEARVECVVAGSSITIVEATRLGAERDEDWLRVPNARLDHDAATGGWVLFCFDADSEPMRYDVWEPDFTLPTSVESILAEVEADPTDVFWG